MYDDKSLESLSAVRAAAAGRNLLPNWTVWFSFTASSYPCCLTIPSRSVLSWKAQKGFSRLLNGFTPAGQKNTVK